MNECTLSYGHRAASRKSYESGWNCYANIHEPCVPA